MNTEKEWWDDEKYRSIVGGYQFSDVYDFPAILAEQKKRDWAEFRAVVKDHYWDSLESQKEMIVHHLNALIDSKLKEL